MAEFLFEYDAAADVWVGPTFSNKTGTLSIVGLLTTETVAVEVQRVIDPDPDTDAHWTPLVQNGDAVVLSADHNAERISGNLLVRIKKAAGVSGNQYTVRYA